jgi:hypothetical protein
MSTKVRKFGSYAVATVLTGSIGHENRIYFTGCSAAEFFSRPVVFLSRPAWTLDHNVMYECKSISKLQMDIELKQIRVLI